MRFSLGSTLAYKVEQPTPFVLNVEAAACERQTGSQPSP